MKLRTRIVLWLTLLLVAIVVVLGAVIVQTNRSVLIGQIDDELLSALQINTGQTRRGRPAGFGFLPDQQAVALIRWDPTGEIFAQPSGYVESPDPLPDVSALRAPDGGPYLTTLTATDRSIRFRAVVFEPGENTTAVMAVPLEEVEASISAILNTTLLAAATVALIGGAATWWTVTRALRPVEEMVATAQGIAGGDLTRRVDDVDPHTELGQLGAALNDMLARIEAAFETERDSQTRLQQFVADASHELRTPITAIAGYMELYQKGALSGEELDRVVARIRREATRMQRLVEDMLLLARLDQEPAGASREFDLMGVIGDAVNDHRAIDSGRTVTIAGPPAVKMRGEEHRISQVISNLLANTRVHTPDSTAVEISVNVTEDDVRIVIADDGPGLDPDHIPHLFDRFYRVDRSRARATGGSGLGLAIVSAIVESYGGSVAASNGPEGGARFEVRLPMAADAQPVVA